MIPSDARVDISTFHLRRRTPGTFVLVPCLRLGRSIRCQGQLEAAAARILAACPAVTHILEQPTSIWYKWYSDRPNVEILAGPPSKLQRRCGKYSYIVPDFLVTMRSGSQWLIEVKPTSKLGRPLVQRKLAVARAFARDHGLAFHVITEQDLFRGPLLRNVRLLGRFGMLAADPSVLTHLESRIMDEPLPLEDFLREAANDHDKSQVKAAVLHLVTRGRLDLDPCTSPISDETLIYPGGTHPWDPFDSAWAPSGSTTDGPSGSSAN